MSLQIAPAAQAETGAIPELVPDRSVKGRFGPNWLNYIRMIVGLPSQRRLARAALQIDRVRYWESEFARMTDLELKQRGRQLRGRARGGESLNRLLPEAFGLVCVVASRTIQMRPFDVQIAAGAAMHEGAVVELATGEGKTLVAALPTYLNALTGKGVHMTTVNDYLAKRDADWIGPIHKALGLSVGCLQGQMPEQEKWDAYRCDITYGTAGEFGFDFLRDQLKIAGGAGPAIPFWTPWTTSGLASQPLDPRVQRKHHYAIVDEADSVFIDDAKTPLIIASPTRLATPEETVVYIWAEKVAVDLERDRHFTLDNKKQKLELTDLGRQIVRYSNPPSGPHSKAMDKLHEAIEQALHAHHRFRRDQHYTVEDDEVVIIDEYSGRLQPMRQWQEGLHQAVEAKEGVPITKASDHAAQITFQSFYRLYEKLAGMTGTCAQNWRELRRVYKTRVVCVPTNRKCIREHLPDRVFPTEAAKYNAAVEEIARLQALGRPILVGTRSVDMSERLSALLQRAGVEHKVLNAKQNESEAKIIEKAGVAGRVTVATNMAGRGTDIKLGPGVTEAGGLHVLATERHDSLRVDRQLAGRSARQGDPGSSQFFLSLEDELLEGLGPTRQEYLEEVGQRGGNVNWQKYHSFFVKAQHKVERRHYRQRFDLLVYEKQRQEILKDLGADPYVD